MIYNFFKVNYSEVYPKKRGFYVKDEASEKHLIQIGSSFLNGYHAILKYKNFDEVLIISEQEDTYYKGFFFEGIGMGLILKDYLSLFQKNNFLKFLHLNNQHKYMLNVGIGWAFARLPFVSIEKEIKKYDPLLSSLILDGYGFHQSYFYKRKYIDNIVLPKKLSDEALHVYFQGVGRALWFICGLDVELIFSNIKKFPIKFQDDLWAGIGLAATYAGKVSVEELEYLKEKSEYSLFSLQQGCSFAAGARKLSNLVNDYTELASFTLTNCTVDELAIINDLALKDIEDTSNSYVKSIQWKESIKKRIKLVNS